VSACNIIKVVSQDPEKVVDRVVDAKIKAVIISCNRFYFIGVGNGIRNPRPSALEAED